MIILNLYYKQSSSFKFGCHSRELISKTLFEIKREAENNLILVSRGGIDLSCGIGVWFKQVEFEQGYSSLIELSCWKFVANLSTLSFIYFLC